MHTSTDYYRGTSREPEATSSLRASFDEYGDLGKMHREVSSRIESLNEAMKLSRQRGAFQQLQTQMKEVKELVKQREDLDGKMAVANLARKKDDDHRLAVKQEVSYSEKLGSVGNRIAELESMLFSYAEQAGGEFDFARCQRPDGSFYGTRGKCKKGRDAGSAPGGQRNSGRPVGGKSKTSGGASKKGPHHEEVKEAKKAFQGHYTELLARRRQLALLEKAAANHEKLTKSDPSAVNKTKLKLFQKALTRMDRVVRRTERESERLRNQWNRAHTKNERAKMTPQQRAAEAALDREIRLRG